MGMSGGGRGGSAGMQKKPGDLSSALGRIGGQFQQQQANYSPLAGPGQKEPGGLAERLRNFGQSDLNMTGIPTPSAGNGFLGGPSSLGAANVQPQRSDFDLSRFMGMMGNQRQGPPLGAPMLPSPQQQRPQQTYNQNDLVDKVMARMARNRGQW